MEQPQPMVHNLLKMTCIDAFEQDSLQYAWCMYGDFFPVFFAIETKLCSCQRHFLLLVVGIIIENSPELL